QWSPQQWRSLAAQPAKLREEIETHVGRTAAAFREFFYAWDVVNEAVGCRDIQKVVGEDALASWYKAAGQAAPDCRLFYNDMVMIEDNAAGSAAQEEAFRIVKMIREKGGLVHGVGLQCHFGPGNLTGIENALATFERLSAMDLEAEITEFDMALGDADVEYAYMRDFLTVCFSHPAVSGFYIWGFWDGANWRGNAAPIYDRNWKEKPGARAWKELVLDRWRTAAKGTTDANGEFRFRGFAGEYEISAGTREGRKAGVRASLQREGTTVTVRME
ncbi:MAG: endo-1,4-beta-xylanase, partial [Planctomycetota bacterium]|nr:endo-1,4-beta-xylanase [Planctomycetota bacterium]